MVFMVNVGKQIPYIDPIGYTCFKHQFSPSAAGSSVRAAHVRHPTVAPSTRHCRNGEAIEKTWENSPLFTVFS